MRIWIRFLVLVSSLLLTQVSGFAAAASSLIPDFEPPPDEYDWVQLTSGEWLKGELISLYDDELIFDSDILGMLTIDGEDISWFRGRRSFSVSIQGEAEKTGVLEVSQDGFSIEREGRRHTFARAQLVSVTPSASRERDKWAAKGTLGFNARRGNSDTIEYNLLASLQRRTPRSRVTFDYLANFNESEGERMANNHRLNASWGVFSGSRLFWLPLHGQYFRDPFQNIDHQLTVETGFGYELIDNFRTEWLVSAGLGANSVRYGSVGVGEDDRHRSPALTLGTDYETELTAWLDYLLVAQVTFLDEESGRYQSHLLTTLSTELFGPLDLDLSLVWDRIGEPQIVADGGAPEQDDFRLMVGIGFEF
jgi:hypothetical protein